MDISVKTVGLGETVADFTDGRVILGEEGRIAVTMEDSDGRLGVAVLSLDEADAFASKIKDAVWAARVAASGERTRTRLRDLFSPRLKEGRPW
jgi:hypothetical protein